MLRLIKVSRSLSAKCVSLNNEVSMIRPTLIDLSPTNLNQYSCIVSLDKCNGSFNVVNDLSTKICVPSKTKDEKIKYLI